MAVADPFRIDLDVLPVARTVSGLETIPRQERSTGGQEAERLAEEVIAFHELRRNRPRGRWKRSAETSRKAFELACHYASTRERIPRRARTALAHALGVFARIEIRARGDFLAQRVAQARLVGSEPRNAVLARKYGLTTRAVQSLLNSCPSMRNRIAAVEAFWSRPENQRETDAQRLLAAFHLAVPHERQTFPADIAGRIIAGMDGNAAQKSVARLAAFHLVTGRDAPNDSEIEALAFALKLTKRRKFRGPW